MLLSFGLDTTCGPGKLGSFSVKNRDIVSIVFSFLSITIHTVSCYSLLSMNSSKLTLEKVIELAEPCTAWLHQNS